MSVYLLRQSTYIIPFPWSSYDPFNVCIYTQPHAWSEFSTYRLHTTLIYNISNEFRMIANVNQNELNQTLPGAN